MRDEFATHGASRFYFLGEGSFLTTMRREEEDKAEERRSQASCIPTIPPTSTEEGTDFRFGVVVFGVVVVVVEALAVSLGVSGFGGDPATVTS
jgi:hypothetical protein